MEHTEGYVERDPLTARCPVCLAAPSEKCFYRPDIPGEEHHRLRVQAAAERWVVCDHCKGIGWRPSGLEAKDGGT